MSDQEPQLWHIPLWHPDFGDPRVEFEHLRSFARELLTGVPDARVALDIPEPGLMFVRIGSASGTVAEVYSVPDGHGEGSRRLGIFLLPGTPSEIEIYAEDTEGAARLFALLTAFR
jgi:hypothetical protein